MCEDKYSVVMTSFAGDWEKLEEAVPRIFGHRGLDVSSVVHPDELPSEMVADLPEKDACRIASYLQEFSAQVNVIPTHEVSEVRNRAADLWYTHIGEHHAFTEIEGMIVIASPLGAKHELSTIRQHGDEFSSGGFEDFLNHEHIAPFATELSPREAAREGNRLVGTLRHDLQMLFPDRSFVICHDFGEKVIFFQAVEGAPLEPEPKDATLPKEAWCKCCYNMRPYHKRDEPDKEFPQAVWGDCDICGSEVLVTGPEIHIIIGPAETIEK